MTPEEAYYYAKKYGPSDETREIACKDPRFAYNYALEVDKFLHMQGMDANSQLLEQSKINLKQQELTQKRQTDTQKMNLEREKLKSKEKIEKMKLRNPVAGEKK